MEASQKRAANVFAKRITANSSAVYCLKPIRRVLDAETFLLNAGRKQTFVVGNGLSTDFAVRNSDICERQAQFIKSPEGWCLRDVSDSGYAIHINWNIIEKQSQVCVEDGDVISFRYNYGSFVYYYLYTKYEITDSFKIGQLSFDGALVESFCRIPKIDNAVKALKENIEYLGQALYAKNRQIKALRAELARLSEGNLKIINDDSFKLITQTRKNEVLENEKRILSSTLNERANETKLLLENSTKYKNIIENYKTRMGEKEVSIANLLRQVKEQKEIIKNQESQVRGLTEENGSLRKSVDLNKQNEKQLQLQLESERRTNKSLQYDDERVLSERARMIEDLRRKLKEVENDVLDSRSVNVKLAEDNEKLKRSIVSNEQVEKRFEQNLELEIRKRNEEITVRKQNEKQLQLMLQNERRAKLEEFNKVNDLQMSLRRQLADETKAKVALQTEKESVNQNLKVYESRYLDDQRVISERTGTIEDLRRKLKEVEHQLSDSRSVTGKLVEDHEKLRRTIVSKEQVEKRLTEDNEKLKGTIVLNEQVEKRLKQNLDIEIRKKSEEKKLCEQRHSGYEQIKVKMLEKEIERLKKVENDGQNHTASMAEEIEKLNEVITAQRLTDRCLENAISENDTKLNESQRQVTLLKNQVSRLNDILDEKEAKQKDIDEKLRDKNVEIFGRNDDRQKENTSLKAEVSNLKAVVKENEKNIEDLKEIIVRQNALLDEATANYNKVVNENEEIKNRKETEVRKLNMALKERELKSQISTDKLLERNAETQTKRDILESDRLLQLEEENKQLCKMKESLKKGILQLQEISDEKEDKAEQQLESKTREIKDLQQARAENETFYREIKSNLRCPICTEVFQKAVALNCSHSFCEPCINDWRRAKNECPTCRCVVDQQIDVLALDQIVEIVAPFKP